VSTCVAAPAAPNGDNGNHQGHCSRCGKIWTLNERQGICQWCHKPASCQSSTSKPRHFKSSSRRKPKQANGHNSYDQLTEPYLTYYKIASRFAHKAKVDDQQDLLHDIILTLARAERNNGHKPFTDAVMYRIASRAQADYWYKHYKLTMGLDCGHCSSKQRRKCKERWLYGECPKAIKLESLNKPVIDSEGNTTELGELIADDNADLTPRLEAKLILESYPTRFVQLAYKKYAGYQLTDTERKDYWKEQKKAQKTLVYG
jgi:DNA-directed RNA polymerase specialized sigma24 family protein